MGFLGTGIWRMINMGLIAVLLITAAVTAWNKFVKDPYQEKGRAEITKQVDDQNDKLDEEVREVNENINRRVITTYQTINRQSQDVEDTINAQPSEPLSNVSRARADRVREQQRDIREAGKGSE